MPIRNRFEALQPEIAGWRRDFHANPELGFALERTAGRVAELLRGMGCDDVVEGIGRTGVVGLIHGRGGPGGRVVGLRADMDALPIHERTGAAHASTVPGRMHACGHDGHTAMLLGAAKYLAETRNFAGTVALVFQPAEEGEGGAAAMLEDGLIDRFGISEIYGLHNSPYLPFGAFSIRPGPFYAAVDSIRIEVSGKGGHAARPNACTDQTLAASAIVVALQSVVSRATDPVQPLVVSITSIRTATEAFNVIPDAVTLRGTVRSFDMEVRAATLERIGAIARLTAEAHGAEAVLHHEEVPYPGMENHPDETAHCADAARAVTGDCDADAPCTTGGEDFGFMLQACPGAYIRLGIGEGPGLHHPEYDFNDEIIPVGCSYLVELAERRLA